jgi:hypothetical protein
MPMLKAKRDPPQMATGSIEMSNALTTVPGENCGPDEYHSSAMRRRWLLWILVLSILAAGHLGYWYWPRLRLRAPTASDLPARLLLSGTHPVALWIPYPHQNLGQLRRRLPATHGLLEAVSRLLGLEPPQLLPFGPFSLPPSRELTVAWSPDGRRWSAAARVYPSVAAAARLGGALADNPWLGGGAVRVAGQDAQVRWRGTLWGVDVGGAAPLAEPNLPAAPASLALVHLRQDLPPIPAGTYRLHSHPGGLTIRAVGEAGVEAYQPETGEVALLAYSSSAAQQGEAPSALALFAREAPSRHELPAAAVWYQSGGGRWHLPGESLAAVLGMELPQGDSGGWGIVATDSISLQQALALTPEVTSLSSPRSAFSLAFGMWLRPRPASEIAASVASSLAAFPLRSAGQLQRWQDVRSVLGALDLERLTYLRESFSLGPWPEGGSPCRFGSIS